MPERALRDPARRRIALGTRIRRAATRAILGVYLQSLALLTRIRRRRSPSSGPQQILLTGTYHSHNWIRAHLGPLSESRGCARILMVTTSSLPDLPNVVAISPPRWLIRTLGAVPSRLLTFLFAGVRYQPDIVGGFHLLVNGLVAIWLARAIGARAWYFSVGGITELRDGGVWGENPHFARLGVPDPIVERQLVQAVGYADLVITMGTSAIADLRARGAQTRFEVISGGIADLPRPALAAPPDFDLVLVARLVPIKQIDLFLRAIALLRQRRPALTAAIVGDGPLRAELTAQAAALALGDAVTFAGQQSDVRAWLRRSRVFVLTSRSEGLALSLMEAMMEGLPAVVPDVGDLADLVVNDQNGFLIAEPSAERFADAFERALDPDRYDALARRARQAGLGHAVASTIAKWDRILDAGRADGGLAALSASRDAHDPIAG